MTPRGTSQASLTVAVLRHKQQEEQMIVCILIDFCLYAPEDQPHACPGLA
jgi:hypothetical protein